MSINDEIRAVVREELRSVLAELRSLLAVAAPAPTSDALLTVEQVATRCGGVEPETVRGWIHKGGLRARRPPGSRLLLISPADLERFLAVANGDRETIEPEKHMQLVHQRVKRAAGSR